MAHQTVSAHTIYQQQLGQYTAHIVNPYAGYSQQQLSQYYPFHHQQELSDYIYFNRNLYTLTMNQLENATVTKLKLEHYYKKTVEDVIDRTKR